jgi:hypothetical protein
MPSKFFAQNIKSELRSEHRGEHEKEKLRLGEVEDDFAAILEFILNVRVNVLYGFHGDVKQFFWSLFYSGFAK